MSITCFLEVCYFPRSTIKNVNTDCKHRLGIFPTRRIFLIVLEAGIPRSRIRQVCFCVFGLLDPLPFSFCKYILISLCPLNVPALLQYGLHFWIIFELIIVLRTFFPNILTLRIKVLSTTFRENTFLSTRQHSFQTYLL